MAVCIVRQLSKLAARISKPFVKCLQRHVRIARTYYLNLIYFCRKHTVLTKLYEFILQNVLKFANYAVEVLVLFCSNFAKYYAATILQGLHTYTPIPFKDS